VIKPVEKSIELTSTQLSRLQRLAIAPSQLQFSTRIVLEREQQHYLSRVLRLNAGDRLIAMDGQGHWWLAQLSASLDSATILQPIHVERELSVDVTLIVALPKTGFDEIVRQTTELGVATLMPTISERTLLKPSAQKITRWRRIAKEAAEQSERLFVPTIVDPISFDKAVNETDRFWRRYICVARGEETHLLDRLAEIPADTPNRATGTIAIAIGPEGGWTSREIDTAIAARFEPVSLGRRILRTLTAPMAALSVAAAAFEKQTGN